MTDDATTVVAEPGVTNNVVPDGWVTFDAADTAARNRGETVTGARKYFAEPWNQWKETVAGPGSSLAAQTQFVEAEFAKLVVQADAAAADLAASSDESEQAA
jgi:hypothetical protein